jgi:hypothetical protein
MPRIVTIDATAQVNASYLDEHARLDDDDASVYRMAGLTAGSCDAEHDARSERGGEGEPEESGRHVS